MATPTTAEVKSRPGTTIPLVLEYSVLRATDYIGASSDQYTYLNFQGIDGEGFFHLWGPWPQAEDESWKLALARRFPSPGTATGADLVMLIDEASDTIVDALLVTGPSAGRLVEVGLSCAGSKPAVLIDRNDSAVRAWQVSEDPLSLNEVDIADLTAEELESACVNRR